MKICMCQHIVGTYIFIHNSGNFCAYVIKPGFRMIFQKMVLNEKKCY